MIKCSVTSVLVMVQMYSCNETLLSTHCATLNTEPAVLDLMTVNSMNKNPPVSHTWELPPQPSGSSSGWSTLSH